MLPRVTRFFRARDARLPALLAIACVASLAACGPAVTVERLVPAAYNLGPARTLVLVESDGPSRWRGDATSRFLSAVSSGGVFRIQDASVASVRLETLGAGDAARAAKAFRRDWPADVYLRLEVVDVTSEHRSDTKKEEKDGQEIVRRRHWAVGECELAVTMLDGRSGRLLADFHVRRSRSTSKRSDPDSDARREAEDRAVDAAVEEAVSSFTPSRVRERLALDDKAPMGKEGIARVETGDLAGARKLWEEALAASPDDARLRYNLGAVSEALGDARAAREYYEDAQRLAPAEGKYRDALDRLEERQRDADALKRRG